MDTHPYSSLADGPVVVGTDGSAGAAPAVLWAAEEAAARSQPLHVVHGTDIDVWGASLDPDAVQPILDSALSLVDEAAKQATDRVPDLAVTTAVSRDSATMSLLQAAREDGTIVVGSRGLGGFSALLLGSVGLKVAARAQGPVVVMRGPEQPAKGGVLVGVQDEEDLPAVRFAATTAGRRKASLRLLSVWTLVQYLESTAPMVQAVREVAEAAATASRRMVGPVRKEFPDLVVNDEVVQVPSPAGALVEASAHADLLVVGTRKHTYAPGTSLGRVTHAVLHHAHCPVAVFPR
ncbi:universal stress protein [Streptomyces sp. NEAU-S7GS2]|uniref:universal stress protein n=1 Tax=Streptomyces sp. NEAU-S7GS2 TaxID=2202000 RepID=UPI000D6F58AE|nr:universal stress protein [Streptomyces sp. NEAU-S7GS2]AWN30599.1 universal stress protein UspA [Streptomyces sp. NEAU-S7GS2]